MGVYVDYGAGSVLYSVAATPAYTSPVSAQVTARGDSVYGYLTDLEATADNAAAEALDKIEALRTFSASVGSVNFVVPPPPNAELQPLPPIPALDLTAPEVVNSDLDIDFDYSLEAAVSKSWAGPASSSYATPPQPGLTPPQPLPAAPADYVFPSVPVPELDIPDFAPTDVVAPVIDLVDFTFTSDLVLEPLDLVVDTSGLEAAIAAYEDYNPQAPVLPEYIYLIPEVFEVTGRMAAGDTIVNYAQLLDARDDLLHGTAPSTAAPFMRRGLAPVTGAPEYDEWLRGKTLASADTKDTIFEAKAIDDCVKAAFQLGTAAHRMLVDIATALYDLEFQAAKAIVQGQLSLAEATAAIYNANVLILQNAVAQYNAQAATIAGAAKAFEVQAREAGVLARANTTLASAFTASERAKQVAARVYKSQIEAETAKLTQYRAYLETYEAQVQSARSAVEQFSGATMRYSSEVDRMASEYNLYAAGTRSIAAQNSALVGSAQAQQSEVRGIASRADARAASAAAQAVALQARAAVRETAYLKRALGNDEESTGMSADANAYSLGITEYITDLTAQSVEFSGKSALARSIASYVTTASNAVSRAAGLSQTANTQLARAYEQVYTAAGSAGAAVASGKLSGFRASATMSASDRLTASDTWGVSATTSGTNSYSESNNYT